MIHPDLAAQALASGAAEVQFVGCPPEDCASREGNVFMQGRLDRKRLPRAGRELDGAAVTADWLPPDDFRAALTATAHQAGATAYDYVVSRRSWRRLIPLAALLLAVMAAAVLLSRIPYAAYAGDRAQVEIFLTHRRGAALAGYEGVSGGQAGGATPMRLLLEADGVAVLDQAFPIEAARPLLETYEQVALAPGQHRLRLSLKDPALATAPVVLLDREVVLQPRQVMPLSFRDAHLAGDPAAGEKLFSETRGGTGTGCRICHSLQPGVKLVGPSLAGIGARASTRVPGLSAEAYLRQSLMEPDVFVVEGYRRGQMPPDYLSRLSREQIDDLVAYMLILR